jgi:Skp family chaperone for outer membrane proteins
MLRFCLGISWFLFFDSSSSMAAALVEKVGRIEVDWTNQVVKLFGEALPKDAAESLSETERKARQEGLAALREEVEGFYKNHYPDENSDQLARQAKDAAQLAVRRSYSTNTNYYPDGRVKVSLEVPLSPTLARSNLNFREAINEENGDNEATFTGLVLRLNQAMAPRASFKVVNESGSVLYSESSLLAEAYKKQLMGRWVHQKATQNEIRRFAGLKPMELDGKVVDSSTIQVSSADWAKLGKKQPLMLARSSVLILVP